MVLYLFKFKWIWKDVSCQFQSLILLVLEIYQGKSLRHIVFEHFTTKPSTCSILWSAPSKTLLSQHSWQIGHRYLIVSMGKICRECSTATSSAMTHTSTWKLSCFWWVYNWLECFAHVRNHFQRLVTKIGSLWLIKTKSPMWRRTPLCFGLYTGISTLYEFGTRIPKQQKWVWDMLQWGQYIYWNNWYPSVSKCLVFPGHCCCVAEGNITTLSLFWCRIRSLSHEAFYDQCIS